MTSEKTIRQRVTAAALGLWTAVLTAVPALATTKNHPDWNRFYDAAQHWHVFSVTRELGQLLAVIFGKILDFFEGSLYGMVFANGGEFVDKIDFLHVFADGSGRSGRQNFFMILTAFVIVGLISYGIWILMHPEQTGNTTRYFARQVIALVGTVVLIPAMFGTFWNIAGKWYQGTLGDAQTHTSKSQQVLGEKSKISITGVDASAACINDNVIDWYWIAGKGGIIAGDSKEGEQAKRSPGIISWEALRGPSQEYYTCSPYLGGCGWDAIAPMQYITDDGVDDYNKTATTKAWESVKEDTEQAMLTDKQENKRTLETRRLAYKYKYYENLCQVTPTGQNNKHDHKDDGEIEDNVKSNVFTKDEDGSEISAAKGSDGPIKVLFKNGMNNPPWYRYTINWIPLLIEEFALAAFYFAITLKTLRILFDVIITGIVAPLFVATDFWGESGQKTKTIYRSIINGFVSICALAFEAELFEIFCCVISNQSLPNSWFTNGFFKALEYLAIGYIGIKGADIFKKLNLDVDTSEAMKPVKAVGKAAGTAALAGAGAVASSGLALASGHDMLKARHEDKDDKDKGKGAPAAIGGGGSGTDPDDHDDGGGAAKALPGGKDQDTGTGVNNHNGNFAGKIQQNRAKRKEAVQAGRLRQMADKIDGGTAGGSGTALNHVKGAPGQTGTNGKPAEPTLGQEKQAKRAALNGKDTAPVPAEQPLNAAQQARKDQEPVSGKTDDVSAEVKAETAQVQAETNLNPAGQPGDQPGKQPGDQPAGGASDQKSETDGEPAAGTAAAAAAASALKQDENTTSSGETKKSADKLGEPVAKPKAEPAGGEVKKSSEDLANPKGDTPAAIGQKKASTTGAPKGENEEPEAPKIPSATAAAEGADTLNEANTAAENRETADKVSANLADPEGGNHETEKAAVPSADGASPLGDNPMNAQPEDQDTLPNNRKDTAAESDSGTALEQNHGEEPAERTANGDSGNPGTILEQNNGEEPAEPAAEETSGTAEANLINRQPADPGVSGESGESPEPGAPQENTNSNLEANGSGSGPANDFASEPGPSISGQRQVGFVSPHSMGQRGLIGARYQGKGRVGQYTADAYGHEMAFMQNAFAIHDIHKASRQEAKATTTGHFQKVRVAAKTAGKTIGRTTQGYIRAKQSEYNSYLAPGNDNNRETGQRYQQLQDARPKNTMNDEKPGN